MSTVSFLSLPPELWVKIFQPFPLQELASLRIVCSQFRTAIDVSPELQIQMVFEHMISMQSQCNILADDLKFDLQNSRLIVEVGNNLTLHKFLHTSLLKALPWITRIIVKNAHPDEIQNLYWDLKESKCLRAVYLVNCRAEPKFLPQEKIVNVDPTKEEEYSFPRILMGEDDLVALEAFCRQVEDDSTPAETVLKTMEEVAPSIRGDIFTSIWHGALMPLTGESQPKNLIEKQVEDFIAKEPHSAHIRAAADKSLEKLKRNISF